MLLPGREGAAVQDGAAGVMDGPPPGMPEQRALRPHGMHAGIGRRMHGTQFAQFSAEVLQRGAAAVLEAVWKQSLYKTKP